MELAVTGYSGTVTEVWWDGDSWEQELMFQDVGRDHMIKVGDFYPEHEGNEVAVVGLVPSSEVYVLPKQCSDLFQIPCVLIPLPFPVSIKQI